MRQRDREPTKHAAKTCFEPYSASFLCGQMPLLNKATPSFCGGGKGRFLKPKATPFCGDSSRLIAMPYQSASPLFHIVFMSGFCKIFYIRFCIKIPILGIICIVLFTFLEVFERMSPSSLLSVNFSSANISDRQYRRVLCNQAFSDKKKRPI